MVGVRPENAGREAPQSATVLVIDDDEDLRGYIRDCLRREGRHISVLEAADAEEALQLLEDATPDLVITDVVMRGMDGFSLTREIRGSHPPRDLPVLLVTGELSRREAASRAVEVGAQATLAKPFNAQELCSVVARLLGARAPPASRGAGIDE